MTKSATPLRILFLSSDSGGGHNAVARALAENIEQSTDVKHHTLNVYQTPKLRLWPLLSRVRTKSSTIWYLIYHFTDNQRFIRKIWQHLLPRFMYPLQYAISKKLDDTPHMIVAVHHAAAQCVESLANSFDKRAFTAVFITDYDAHANWIAEADLYFVASQLAYNKLVSAKKRVVRLPMLPCRYPEELREKPARAEGKKFRLIMVMGLEGSSGRKLYRLINKLLTLSPEIQLELDIICGRNAKLKQELCRKYSDMEKIDIYGFVNDLPQRMQVADLAVIRLSPQTMTEALAAATPVIGFDWHVHEQENLNVLQESGAGTGSCKVSETFKHLQRFFTDAELRNKWYMSARQAAEQIPENAPDQLLLSHFDEHQLEQLKTEKV